MKNVVVGKYGVGLAFATIAVGVSAALAQTPGKAVKSAASSSGAPNPPASATKATTFSLDQITFFEKQVRPILTANCFSCHGEGANLSGNLALNTRAGVLKGGASGPAVVLAKPHESLFLNAVNYKDRQMPPKGKLPASQIEILTKWVDMGMPWPAEGKPGDPTTPVKHGPPQVNAETMKFWAFQPVRPRQVPTVKRKSWVTNPIDAFVLAKLESKGLTPASPTGKTALLRRAYYDLIGLPPTPEQTAAFLADKSPNAYEKVVDRLLASPQYGEKWARHWLDLVRYAETNSFERDDPKPFAWRYRDYIIQSLNTDKPYDQFVREQLAGDELDKVTPETLIATGYYRLGQWDDEPSDPEQARYDELDDIVATTGQTFLGLTVNCARCHDHKLDPIPQKDYYRLLSFFQGVQRYGLRGGDMVAQASLRPIANEAERARYAQDMAAYTRKLEDVTAQRADIENVVRKDFSPVENEEFRHEQNRLPIMQKRVPRLLGEDKFAEYQSLAKQQDQLRKSPPRGLEQALCVTEAGRKPEPTCVLMRGNPHVKGEVVEPAFLSVLAPPAPIIRPPDSNPSSSGRRLALANWIASANNPLTARVLVNRLWQHHFGRGIVRSSSNFGMQGTPPTHPELLDWLAGEVVKNGWKLKPLHKLMMMSSTYRMSSQAEPKALAQDPENEWMWRFDMRRLDAEEIRDSILAVDGGLNPKMFGPSIYPTIPAEVLAGQSRPGSGWPTSPPEEQTRRSVYVHIKRSLAVPMLASFDAADTDSTCPVRFATTQPTQALSMMNSTFLNEQAKQFADYAQKQAGAVPASQVKLILRRTLQREPTIQEIGRGVKFIATMQTEHKTTEPDALRYFCVVALNLNEFIYLD